MSLHGNVSWTHSSEATFIIEVNDMGFCLYLPNQCGEESNNDERQTWKTGWSHHRRRDNWGFCEAYSEGNRLSFYKFQQMWMLIMDNNIMLTGTHANPGISPQPPAVHVITCHINATYWISYFMMVRQLMKAMMGFVIQISQTSPILSCFCPLTYKMTGFLCPGIVCLLGWNFMQWQTEMEKKVDYCGRQLWFGHK